MTIVDAPLVTHDWGAVSLRGRTLSPVARHAIELIDAEVKAMVAGGASVPLRAGSSSGPPRQ